MTYKLCCGQIIVVVYSSSTSASALITRRSGISSSLQVDVFVFYVSSPLLHPEINSTPLMKGPGAPVLMAAGPLLESDSRRGEARRHPRHTPVDRATKQKRVTLAPPPALPLSSP
ncbi:unnamed protein product [Pleuronectes platessa]|uniref:Uncharacterized protein n=1 Tax=Pleuronectes platessa TaxID=8262 RepID=A0A9N7U575_PLEPL|nr:unnamed protein product [Pleuronectes platessa]